MARHRHQEFIRFLNRSRPQCRPQAHSRDPLHYAVHKHPRVRNWLGRHPRWTFHFTPTSCSWPMRSRSFSPPYPPPIAARRLPLARRPAGRDQPLSREHNRKPKPFVYRRSRSHYPKSTAAPSDRVTPLVAPGAPIADDSENHRKESRGMKYDLLLTSGEVLDPAAGCAARWISASLAARSLRWRRRYPPRKLGARSAPKADW